MYVCISMEIATIYALLGHLTINRFNLPLMTSLHHSVQYYIPIYIHESPGNGF